MSNPQRRADSPSSRAASNAGPFERVAGDAASSRPPSGTSAKKGLSSLAPSDAPRGAGAETKLYQVPRELIEIARANARNRSRAAAGTLTPIAPRPDVELEAAAKAYADLVAEGPATPSDIRQLLPEGAPPEGVPASSGTRLAVASRSERAANALPDEVSLVGSRASEAERLGAGSEPVLEVAPAALDEEREAIAAERAASAAERAASAATPDRTRLWLYAGVLLALGYYAQLAWPW